MKNALVADVISALKDAVTANRLQPIDQGKVVVKEPIRHYEGETKVIVSIQSEGRTTNLIQGKVFPKEYKGNGSGEDHLILMATYHFPST